MKILLAIDPSAASEAALDEVAVRPWPPGTTVEVLGVVDPSHFLEVPQLIDRVTQRTEELVQRERNVWGLLEWKQRPLCCQATLKLSLWIVPDP
jgi:hypothetical protein